MSINFLEDIATLTRGQLGHGLHDWISSRRLTVDAPAGVYVVPSDDGECRPPTSAAEVTNGNGGVLELLVDRIANANGLEYASGDYARYVSMGRIVMITEEAVSDQDPVYIRFATKGGNTQLGAARTDADGDGAETLVFTNTIAADTNVAIVIDDESFVVATGASGNATTIAGLMATAINASAAFAATDNADGTFDVTRVDGGSPGSTDLETPDGLTAAYATDADPETAALLPRAFFEHDWSSGLALVKLG